MKKRVISVLMAVMMFSLVACGSEKSSTSGGSSSSSKTSSDNGSADAGKGTAKEPQADAYKFEYKGVSIAVDADVSGIISALGDADSYHEEKSCAFEGLDKVYTYGSIEIDTYPDGDIDRVSSIIILDDLVKTPEGVSLYNTVDDMKAAYGSNYTEDTNLFVYEKGGMKLRFIIKDNEIASIEYMSTAADA